MNPHFRIYFIAISLLICLAGSAQDTRQKITANLDSLSSFYPYEKIFVHTDRKTYGAGETIWCRVYCMMDGKPSFLSSVAYLELVDHAGNVLRKKMLKLINGAATSEVFLQEDLAAGTYQLNAYTSYMLNAPSFIYRQPIFVYNIGFKNNSAAAAATDFSLAFFPEGGDLVEGVTSRVAFKAMHYNGLPVTISGDILDSKNQLVTKFFSQHDGMGSFELTPVAGEKYKAVLIASGQTRSFPIPLVKKEGALLKADNTGARIFVEAKRGTNNADAYNELLLVCQMNHVIVYMANMNFAEGLTATSISRKNLPAGIMQITLFDKTGKPLSERLVYNAGPDSAKNYSLRTDTIGLSKRKKNVWQLELPGFTNVSASASVVNVNAASQPGDENIISWFQLSSDLRGYIHKPAFYFKDREPATVQALDLLMMTHGWRRFDWTALMNNKFPSISYPIETGIWVKGKVLSAAGKTLSNARADIITKAEDSTTIVSTATIDKNSEFVVTDLEFRERANIFAQGTNINREKAASDIVFAPSYIDTLKNSKFFPLVDFSPNAANSAIVFSSYWQSIIDDQDAAAKAKGKMLAEVVVVGKRRSPLDSMNNLYATDLYRYSDRTLMVDSAVTFSTIWQFLAYKVPGLRIAKDEYGETIVEFRRYAGMNFFSQDTETGLLFFLNEVPVTKDIIENLDMNDVALVKTWEGPSGSILGADRGAIGVYTVKGRTLKQSPWAKDFKSIVKMGYSVPREFFHMDYNDPASKDVETDKRATLYWSPEIKIDANGRATIRFFNDDVSNKFKLTVQGVDKNGKLLYFEKLVE